MTTGPVGPNSLGYVCATGFAAERGGDNLVPSSLRLVQQRNDREISSFGCIFCSRGDQEILPFQVGLPVQKKKRHRSTQAHLSCVVPNVGKIPELILD